MSNGYVEKRFNSVQCLANHKANGNSSVLNYPKTHREDNHLIRRKEVESAAQLLKKGKTARVENLPAEQVQASGEDVITALTTIWDKIWQTGEWPIPWTQPLDITLPNKGNLQHTHKLFQNYRTARLINHRSKVMPKIILNRLNPQAEKIIAVKQADFRAGRSTSEQIFT